MIVLPPIGSDLGYAPQASSLNEIDGIAKVAPAALLHAALQDLLAGADCPAEGGAFLNGVGDRFFKIDVFACCQGVDRHAHMPVVGRGDNDGIDRLLEDCAIIHMGGCDAIGTLFDGVASRSINIANGDDLVVAEVVGGIEQVAHAAASANYSDAQGVVGAEDSG